MPHALPLDFTPSEVLAARQFALSLAVAQVPPTSPDAATASLRLADELVAWLLTGGAAEAVAAPAKVKRHSPNARATYEAAFDAREAPKLAAARLGTKPAIVRAAYTRIRRARGIPQLTNNNAAFGRNGIAADTAA